MTITWDDAADSSTPSSGIQWDEQDDSLLGKAKEMGKALSGGAEAGLELIPKMVIGMGAYATGAATEALEGTTRSVFGKGQPATLESITGAGEHLAGQATDWRMQESARPVEEAFGRGISAAIEGVGTFAEQMALQAEHQTDPLSIEPGKYTSPIQPGEAYPGFRSFTEAASQFIPLERIVSGFKGGRPVKEPILKSDEPTTNPLSYEPGPKRDIIKQGTRDETLTNTEIPVFDPKEERKKWLESLGMWEFKDKTYERDPDTGMAREVRWGGNSGPTEPPGGGGGGGISGETLTPGYTYKNKSVSDRFDQYDLRRGSDMQGIDFTTFSLEDPKQLEHLQGQLKDIGIESDITQARILAAQMKDKTAVADERVKGLPQTITKRIPPIAIPEENVVNGYKKINASPMNSHVELVDTRLMELMRDHDRLTEPKGLNQFLEKENSVLNNGVHKGLTLHYWPEENRIVQVNGNTRRGVAAKHGMMEIPAYVRIMEGKVPDEWQRTAVSIPGLKFEGIAKGQFAKPSDIGLPSRTLNDGVFNPKIKYAPEPTVDAMKIPAGHFQNNYLFAIQHNELPQFGARKGLHVVRDTSSIPFYREVAKLLLDDKTFNPQFAIKEFGDKGYKDSTRGQYSPRAHQMSVRRDSVGSEYVFMHEAIHAATLSALERLQYGQLDRMHPAYDGAKRLIDLWQSLKTSTETNLIDAFEGSPQSKSPLYQVFDKYGMTNPHEFVAEAFTNPEFQNLLKQISLPDHLQTKGFQYYWDGFVKALADLIGIKSGQQNYLAATLSAGAEIMRKSTKQDRMFYALEQKPESWYPRATGVKGGPDFVSDLVEKKKLLGIDRRPLKDVIKESGFTAETFKDLDNGDKGNLLQMLWGGTKLLGRQLVENRTVALLNQTLPGTGAILRNIADRTFLTDRWTISQINETMKGKELTEGFTGRFVHRLGSRDGIDPTFKWLGDEASKMLQKWLPSSGGKDYLTRSSFENDKQWNGYNIIQNQVQRGLGIVNDLRTKLGKPLIEPLKNFFPFSRPVGDYRVVIKDNMGNIRNLETFQRASPLRVLDGLYDANKYATKMKELFPYMEVSDPMHVDKTHLRDIDGKVLSELERAIKKQDTDYEVWAEAERINRSDHPLSQLIQKAKTEHFTKLGMGGHLIERAKGEQIGGYLGSDFNPQKAREGLQQYFEYLYQYAGNLNKALIEKELNSLEIPSKDGTTKTLSQVAPNLDTYLHQVMELARGQKNSMDMSEQIFLGELTKRIGEGESAPTRGMSGMSRLAMVWYLFKPSFFGTQPIQTANALAHLTELTGSTTKSVGHFLSGIQSAMVPSAADKAGVNWAVKNGYIDPGTSHLLDDYNSSVPTRVFLKTTGTIEREAVRIPSFLMFEHALRDTIKDPEKRYETAAEKMAYSMSMVNRSNQPLIWNKLGIIGQGMRQLKSYSTNVWGQFAHFVNLAEDQKQYKPLATFMGTGLLIGGVKGTIGVAEATALITAFNYMTNSNVQTPVEWLLKNGAPTGLAYGMASEVTGRDISNQVGNPSGFNYLDPIPFKFAYDIASANLEYAIAAGQNQLTDSIRLKTWLANTPPVTHEAIRNAFNKEGQPVPSPFLNMGGTYYRNEKQRVLSTATGTRSVEETKADDLQRFFKQHEQRLVANKSQVQNAMVDDILNGKGVDPQKIQEYMQYGGAPSNLSTDLKNTLIERHRSSIFNEIINKSKTTAQAKKLQEVEPYLRNQPENIFPPSQGSIEWDKQ